MANTDKKAKAGCLDGIRVLELARFQAGPRCGMVLSDMGAEVIKIEKLAGEDTRQSKPIVRGQSIYFSVYNRGKKSMCLDLRKDEGKAIFFKLLKSADMVLENFRPGTIEKMGLAYEELIKVKPDIILIRVSGFGQYGPYRDRAAYDTLGQAMSGLMMLTGAQIAGEPIGTSFSLVDRISSLHATIASLGALRHRDRTGRGQIIDVCLMDAALTTTEIPTSYYLSTGKTGGESSRKPYRTTDGYVAISAGSSRRLNEKVHALIGLTYEGDKQSDSGSFFGEKIPGMIAWCKQRTSAEVVEKLTEIGCPAAPVYTVPQVAKDPHLWERQMLVKMEDPIAGELYLPGLFAKFSETPARIGPVPTAGQHTGEIMNELGYSSQEVKQLQESGILK